jgi:hypothetical protein
MGNDTKNGEKTVLKSLFTNYEPKEFFQSTVTTKSIINADLNFQFTKVQPKNTNKLIKSTTYIKITVIKKNVLLLLWYLFFTLCYNL